MTDIKIGQTITGSFSSSDPKFFNSSNTTYYYDDYDLKDLAAFQQGISTIKRSAIDGSLGIALVNADTNTVISGFQISDFPDVYTGVSATTFIDGVNSSLGLAGSSFPGVNYKIRVFSSHFGNYELAIADEGKGTSIVSNDLSNYIGSVGTSGIVFPQVFNNAAATYSDSGLVFPTANSTTDTFTDIAIGSNRKLYTIGYDSLYQLDPSVPIGQQVKKLGVIKDDQGNSVIGKLNALEFTDNNLYAIGTSKFYQIDPNTITAKLLATLPIGFSSSGDLTYDKTNNRFLATSTDTDSTTNTLWQIPLNNPSQSTKIGQIGFNNVYGLNFENSELIGFSNPDFSSGSAQRIKIDPITGKGTFDRQITIGYNGSGFSTNLNINGSSRIPTFDVVNTDLAGNTAATARNIGKLIARQSFDDFIGYYNSTSQDGVDYYKFTIDQKSAVTLSVGGIAFTDGELRLELRNDKDEVIRFTNNTNDIHALLNPDSERTSGSLLPGTYFARVTSNNSSKGGAYSFSASAKPQVENSATFKKPVFVIPGIGGSLWDISAPDSKQREEEWYSKRGLDPNKLVIDPLGESYSSLIASLKDAGYQEGKDLFIVPYDWRLAPAPTDGTSDGKVSGISAVSITDGTYEYGVDYLGHYLKQASESWLASHNGQTLDSVDIIAHSTGGLIARAYMQSNAYGGQFSNLSLPLVDNLITLGVPNSGSPKAWNILNDDWNSDKVFATVFRNLAFKAYERLRLGKVVDGSRVTKQSIISATGDSDFGSQKNKIEFINQYFPSIQALLSTDDFGVAVPEKQKNKLLLDLNAGSGIRSIGFNGQVSELYGDDDYQGSNGTINFIEKKTYGVIESLLNKKPVQSLTEFVNLPILIGDSYYDETRAKNSGDGTVLTSSATLINTSNSLSVKDTFFDNVDHGKLPNNKDVINKILGVLNQPEIDGLKIINPFAEAYQLWAKSTIAGGLSNFVKDILAQTKGSRDANLLGLGESIGGAIVSLDEFIDGAILSIDPVEGFIVDSQGRRLGYSKSTGALNEIPNSVWFGGAEEGIGYIKGKLDPAVKLQLSGLGEDHQVTLFGIQDGKLVTAESSGFLANGQTKQVPLTFTQIPVTQPFTLQKATADNVWNVNGSGKVKVSLLGKSTTQLNEIGIFKVDATNKVNGISPGATGFAKAAIESGSVVFTALPGSVTDGLDLSHSFKVNNGERLGFFLVANSSAEEDFKTNNFSNVTTSADLVNPYTTSPAQVPLQVKENQGLYTLDWKQGDKNLSFNFQVDPAPDTSLASISSQQGQKEGEVLDLRAFTGQNVQATFTLKREAAYNDSISFYKIDDVTGTITSSNGQKFKPGDSGYVQAALNNKISGLDLAGKNGQTITAAKVLQGGSLYAPILMSNVTSSNPTGDYAFTAFSLGNIDRTDHVRLLGDNTFGFEDLFGGGDKDFNDIIVQASFKTV